MIKLSQIRSTFLDFFEKNNHKILPSSSLIPHNDPSLMFVNSGMVPFKNYFTGEQTPDFRRITTSQKSVRAGGKHNDLDNVGYTARHHTFFEMLGNFSFGDYFKDDAIFYAWTLLTKEFGLDRNKLYITIYHDDDEAAKIWKKVAGLSDDRIIRIKTSDNFWSMGDTGPCGPCSEIFYDHGPAIAGGLPGSANEDGDRYIEIWNLVFMQYEQLAGGERTTLPRPCIDTGMGLERVAAVLQNVHNNYDIDLFQNIINATSDIAKVKITASNIASFRVIADHLRSSGFLIADGVMPSNEGRGYVLRRIMRRAMRHVHVIGCKDLLMHQLVDVLCTEMGDSYPELFRSRAAIKSNFYNEENKFRATVSNGLKLLENARSELNSSTATKVQLPGEIAFKLYDTYGFPLDLTIDILRPENIEVDIHGFEQEMAKQKENARKAWKGSGATKEDPIWFDLYQKHGATEFVGYTMEQCQANIIAKIERDDHDIILANQTPFYGESGGQVGDIGFIICSNGEKIAVKDTKKFLGKIIIHITEKSSLKEGESANFAIDKEYRDDVRRNHSATHLLHYSLREILGEHVMQKGSLVAGTHLRFDFAHNESLSRADIEKIECAVNKQILTNSTGLTSLIGLQQAMDTGAMALFGEKYEDEVRVVQFADSVELCGGTHTNATGDIGAFIITSESSIASGVRRIEAITGRAVIAHLQKERSFKEQLEYLLKTPSSEQIIRVEKLLNDKKILERQLGDLKLQILSGTTKAIKQGEQIGKINFITKIEDNISPSDLRHLADMFKKTDSTVVLAMSTYEGKSSMVVAISHDLALNAGDIVKILCNQMGGSGGGKKDLAQAGGFDFSKADEINTILKNLLLTFA